MIKTYRAIFSLSAAAMCLLGPAAASQAQTFISPTLNDGSFETPTTGTLTYNPTGTPWTFTNFAGVSTNSNNGTTIGITGSPADGTQYGFLQVNGSSTTASISQTFTLASLSNVSIAYATGGRTNVNGTFGGATLFSASLDGVSFDTHTTTTGQAFTNFSSSLLSIGAGTHTITFTAAANGSTADNAAVLDNVRLSANGVSSPEPGAAVLALAGAPLFLGALRMRRRNS